MDIEPIRIKTMEVVNDSGYPDPKTTHDIDLLKQMGAEVSTLEMRNRTIVYISDKPFLTRIREAFTRGRH